MGNTQKELDDLCTFLGLDPGDYAHGNLSEHVDYLRQEMMRRQTELIKEARRREAQLTSEQLNDEAENWLR